MTGRLCYVYGDDDLRAARAVEAFAEALATDAGAALERWAARADAANAADVAARLRERLSTPAMFGAGTLAVVANPGALVRRNADRDTVLEAISLLATGNALAFVEATRSDAARKGPGPKKLVAAVEAAGGSQVKAFAPSPRDLPDWVAAEARQRGLAMDPAAARELADRLGNGVTEGDVDRRHLTRIASMEIDKLSLRHVSDGAPVSVDDVRALVAETTPGSMWRLADAVGDRRMDVALATLDRLTDTTPEPVLLATLHRRVRELIEVGDRLAAGVRRSDVVAALGAHPFVVEKLEAQARNWSTDELVRALSGLLELDAMVKNVPGSESDIAQRRLAFTLWIRHHTGARSRGRSTGPG